MNALFKYREAVLENFVIAVVVMLVTMVEMVVIPACMFKRMALNSITIIRNVLIAMADMWRKANSIDSVQSAEETPKPKKTTTIKA